MSNGPQLKSRRSLQPTDSKLARLEAVSSWTEEPAADQAKVVALEATKAATEPQTTPEAAETKEEGVDHWAAVRAIKGPDKPASFRLPEEVHSRLKIAVATLNDSKLTMTVAITQGILDQIAFIEQLIEKKKNKTS